MSSTDLINLIIFLIILKFIINFIKRKQRASRARRKYCYNNRTPQQSKYSCEYDDDRDDSMPYKTKSILTTNEHKFYNELKKITDRHNLIICPKVGLKDLFDITDKNNHMKWFGKIAQKHIDFLICDHTLMPQFAIELDDISHNNEERQDSDHFKNEIFKASCFELIRIKAKFDYTEEYIQQCLNISLSDNQPEDNNVVHQSDAATVNTKNSDPLLEKVKSVLFKKIF